MYRFDSSTERVSSICSILSIPSVVTLSTWVSPRWNMPEPWVLATTPTSAFRAAGCRWGRARRAGCPVRPPGSRIMLLRTRPEGPLAAAPSASSSGMAELGRDLLGGRFLGRRCARLARRCVPTPLSLGAAASPRPARRPRTGSPRPPASRPPRARHAATQLELEVDRLADVRLGLLEPAGDGVLVARRLRRPRSAGARSGWSRPRP